MRIIPFLAGAAVAAGIASFSFPAANAGDPPASSVVKLGNATCPVKGTPVNAKFTTIWNGLEVGFCCPECPAKFTANPNQYTPALLRDLAMQLADAKAKLAKSETTSAKPSDEAAVPTSPEAIRAELKKALASARSLLTEKKLNELHVVAAREIGRAHV